MERQATLYARNETSFWDAEILAKYKIVAAFCVYIVPDDGESTVDVTAYPYENVFHHAPGTWQETKDNARDELSYEGLESPSYLVRDSIASADPRMICRVSLDLDDDEWNEGDAGAIWTEQAGRLKRQRLVAR